jgi:hypothetical protein
MRKSLVVFLFGIATSAAAQDAAKPAPQEAAKPPAAPQELDKDTQTRIRAERFAGQHHAGGESRRQCRRRPAPACEARWCRQARAARSRLREPAGPRRDALSRIKVSGCASRA